MRDLYGFHWGLLKRVLEGIPQEFHKCTKKLRILVSLLRAPSSGLCPSS